MSVYYIHAPDAGRIKIGFSNDPVSRLCKMQVDSPTRLILLAVEDGDRTTEAARHAAFMHLRERGEWFRYKGDLIAHVQSLPPVALPTRAQAVAGPLGDWLFANGHTLDTFAAVVGTTAATLSRICSGQQMPRRDLLIKIVVATDWAVDADALIGVPARPEHRVRAA